MKNDDYIDLQSWGCPGASQRVRKNIVRFRITLVLLALLALILAVVIVRGGGELF